MKKALTKGDPSKLKAWKSNKIIEANYRLTVQEQRLIYLLTSQINNDDEEFQEYEFYIADIAERLGLDKKSQYRHMQEVTSRLIRRGMIIHEKDGPLHLSWLSSAKYYDKEGKVSIAFSPRLKPYLLQLKREFTKLNLDNIIHLKSIYSMRLYELLKQYQNIGERTIKIEELRKMLQITQKSYSIYNNFKQRILLTAEKELFESEKSDIYFTYEEIKESRKVVAMRFFIHKKEIDPNQITLDEAIGDTSEKAKILEAEGIAGPKAITLGAKYSLERIQRNIEYSKKNSPNSLGYLVSAIEQDYAGASANASKKETAATSENQDKFKDIYIT